MWTDKWKRSLVNRGKEQNWIITTIHVPHCWLSLFQMREEQFHAKEKWNACKIRLLSDNGICYGTVCICYWIVFISFMGKWGNSRRAWKHLECNSKWGSQQAIKQDRDVVPVLICSDSFIFETREYYELHKAVAEMLVCKL